MERYLCLDIGDKRIGVAVSDPFNGYALPVNTYHRKNLNADIEYFRALVKEKLATALVCGLPVNFDGTPSVQTEKARFFIEKLKTELKLPVFCEDERCTSCEAEETLIGQGKTRAERKAVIDSLAAANILQAFLNEINHKGVNNMAKKHEHDCGCGCGHDHEHEEKKHVHDEDCGCGHDHEHEEKKHVHDEDCDCGCDCCADEDVVELTADDGRKLKFYLVGTIEYKGKNYSAFEPAEEIDGLNEDDLVIFELSGDDEESAELLPIEDEGLLNEVFEEFCRVLEEDELAEEAESLEPKED